MNIKSEKIVDKEQIESLSKVSQEEIGTPRLPKKQKKNPLFKAIRGRGEIPRE